MKSNIIEIRNSFTKRQASSHSLLTNGPTIFVWTIWALMFVIAFACIFIYGRNIPLAEDWQMVSPLTGHEPHLAKWLWLQNNEHRVPLPKMVLLFLLKITNGDFRIGMVLTVLCVGLLTAYFIRVFYKIRGGRTSYTDAFFPLLLLHLGNWENFFWSWQFTFVLATLLVCILISIVIQYKGLLNLRQAIIGAICMVFLPLCGANGLLYILPVIPWLAFEGYLHFRSKEQGANRRIAFILFGAITIAIILIIFYFIGYQRPSWYPPSPSVITTLKTGIKFMALGFGPGAAEHWGISILLALMLVTVTAALLVFAIIRARGAELRRAVGLFFFLSGNVIFALVMGYGRASQVPVAGLPMRYVLLAVPTLIVCYRSWQLYGLPILKKNIQWGLFITMLILVIPNTNKGFGWRNYYLQGTDAVLKDIANGKPHSQLVVRHREFLLEHFDQSMLWNGMEQLKRAGMGPFKYMKEDTVFVDRP